MPGAFIFAGCFKFTGKGLLLEQPESDKLKRGPLCLRDLHETPRSGGIKHMPHWTDDLYELVREADNVFAFQEGCFQGTRK